MDKEKNKFTFKKSELYKNIINYSYYANMTINAFIGRMYMDDLNEFIMKNNYSDLERKIIFSDLSLTHEGNMIKCSFYFMLVACSIKILETAFHEMIVQNTSDYKTIKTLYDEVIANEVELFKSLELVDPVSAFAGFVNMYRGGYLSSDKEFIYDKNPKDFRKMAGSDVVRGEGVCRNIASMLDDIYKKMGFDSTTLIVNASNEAIESMEHLSSVELDKSKISDDTLNYVKKVEMITNLTKMGNHLLTAVRDEENSYVFDPTNDGLLIPQRIFNLVTGNGPKQKMVYRPLQNIKNGDVKKAIEILNGNSITKEEYKKIYLESQKKINDNLDLLEKFYENNKDMYKEIEEISNKSGGLLERRLPYIYNEIIETIKKRKNQISNCKNNNVFTK